MNAPPSLLRSAASCARRLQGEKLPWADGLAGLIRAGVAACRGDRSSVCAILRDTITVFEASGMPVHAAVARRRLGECLDGTRGIPAHRSGRCRADGNRHSQSQQVNRSVCTCGLAEVVAACSRHGNC